MTPPNNKECYSCYAITNLVSCACGRWHCADCLLCPPNKKECCVLCCKRNHEHTQVHVSGICSCKCHQPTQEWEKEFTDFMRSGGEVIDYEGDIRRDDINGARKKIETFITALLQKHDAELIEKIDGVKYPPEQLQFDEETYEHGHNNALKDIINIVKGV